MDKSFLSRLFFFPTAIPLNKMNIEIIKDRANGIKRERKGQGSFDTTKNEYREGHLKARRKTGGPVTVTKINVRIRSSSYNGLV